MPSVFKDFLNFYNNDNLFILLDIELLIYKSLCKTSVFFILVALLKVY